MILTVILPTFNSARYLERCLDSFERQTLQGAWEVICVDRGSTDGTLAILAERERRWGRLRVIQGGDERTSQVNIGVRASSSIYLYYAGSDFEVDESLLEDAVNVAEETCADGVYLTNVSYGNGYWARVRNLERSTYIGTTKFEAVRFFRRASYDRAGGYADDIPIFEEYDLQNRLESLGASFARVERSVERHLGEPESLAEIWKKSYYYGRRFRSALRRRGGSMLRYANPVRKSFFREWRSFVAQPRLTAGFIVMLGAKYSAGALGLASTYFHIERV